MRATTSSIALLLVFATACGVGELDFDGDGIVDAMDCAPEDPDVFPGQEDPYGDGEDTNCDDVDGIDGDGDGAGPARWTATTATPTSTRTPTRSGATT